MKDRSSTAIVIGGLAGIALWFLILHWMLQT